MNGVADQSRVIGIVVALPEELATVTAIKLKRGQQQQLNPNLWVAYAGAGFANAEMAARNLVADGVQHLISWGCAAALSPDLQAGDLVIADKVIHQSKPIELNITALSTHLSGNIPFHIGSLLHSDDLVSNAQLKQALFQQTTALALDMESSAIVQVAEQAQIPVWVCRTIADTADFDLPVAVVQSLNAEGQVELIRLLTHLVKHPGQLPQLIKLGRYFSAAQRKLRLLLPLIKTI